MVIIRAINLFFMFFDKNAWWDHVIVAPEDRRIIEFNSGISIGLKIFNPIGGHITPSSIFGEILLCKNAQKNLKKNITSDTINIIILYFNRDMVVFVWWPCREDSRFTSRHHIDAVNEIIITVIPTDEIDKKFECSLWIIILAADSNTIEATIGHGLGDTMWNGWDIFIISEFH